MSEVLKMKDRLDRLFKDLLLSRRTFLKYTGVSASLLLANQWLKNPSLVLAQSERPRVVSIHNSNATNWDHTSGYHWEYINQPVVNSMVEKGLMNLTGAANVSDAWRALIPYQPGEAVAIKVNFNNHSTCPSNDNLIDAYPETVNAVIDGLKSIGVPSNRIWITDPSRAIPERFVNKITDPDVHYYTSLSWIRCGPNFYATDYVALDSPAASATTHPSGDVVRPAQVFVDAAHLINMPLLKGHSGSGWMTLSLKNHYGSVTFRNYPSSNQNDERNRMHQYIVPYLNPDTGKSTLADISNNPHIRNKTRLIIGDGLFGNPRNNYESVTRWEIFNNDDPKILFFGTNPIATDSVMCDYISEEQGLPITHSSLHHGAELGLGTHDHWDSFLTKQYALIDYIHIDMDMNHPSVNRVDIDRKIKEFKAGSATEQEVKEMIEMYMETQS